MSLKQCESPSPSPTPTEGERDPLEEKIEEMGTMPWDRNKYDSLSFEIIALSSGNEINSVTEENLNALLEDSKQKALANSIDNWRSGCYRGVDADILNLATKSPRPILRLKKSLDTYNRYLKAASYGSELNRFLSCEYSDQKADKIKRDFLSVANQFMGCSEVYELKAKIFEDCNDFKVFHKDFNDIVVNGGDLRFFSIRKEGNGSERLKKYKHYIKVHEQLEDEKK
jgi:hypothetical protein